MPGTLSRPECTQCAAGAALAERAPSSSQASNRMTRSTDMQRRSMLQSTRRIAALALCLVVCLVPLAWAAGPGDPAPAARSLIIHLTEKGTGFYILDGAAPVN